VSAAVVSLAERRAARGATRPLPPRRGAHLRLVTESDPAPALRLEVFLRRARAVMDGDTGGALVDFPQQIA
jgi:hypothetical protein